MIFPIIFPSAGLNKKAFNNAFWHPLGTFAQDKPCWLPTRPERTGRSFPMEAPELPKTAKASAAKATGADPWSPKRR